MPKRCSWAGNDPIYRAYHDEEWGVSEHDDRILFEMLVLEGAQAGLNWLTILKKRENYRKAFSKFDPRRVARFDRARIERLLQDTGIVRNRLKVESAVANARSLLAIQKEFGSFDRFVWGFTGGKPIVNRWRRMADVPTNTTESEAMSRELKRRGMRFVGPTICYAFMQSTGMVNDHLTTCFRHREIASRS